MPHDTAITEPKINILFPHLGRGLPATMRRIGVIGDVQNAIADIIDCGTGATTDKTLEATIGYYVRPHGRPLESWDAVFDFIEQYVPLDTDMTNVSRDAAKEMFADCQAAAREHMSLYRTMQKRARAA